MKGKLKMIKKIGNKFFVKGPNGTEAGPFKLKQQAVLKEKELKHEQINNKIKKAN